MTRQAGGALRILEVFALTTTISMALSLAACKSDQHRATLTWRAPTEIEVPIEGYNIYRSETPGGPYRVVAFRVPTASFTDTNVKSGMTYYYVVTTVDRSGSESKHSQEVTVKIP